MPCYLRFEGQHVIGPDLDVESLLEAVLGLLQLEPDGPHSQLALPALLPLDGLLGRLLASLLRHPPHTAAASHCCNRLKLLPTASALPRYGYYRARHGGGLDNTVTGLPSLDYRP